LLVIIFQLESDKKQTKEMLCTLRLEDCRNHAALENIQGNGLLPSIVLP